MFLYFQKKMKVYFYIAMRLIEEWFALQGVHLCNACFDRLLSSMQNQAALQADCQPHSSTGLRVKVEQALEYILSPA